MTRKYALFGSGNTGSKIPELLNVDEQYTFFNSANPPTVENLAGYDAVICFVAGPVMMEYLDVLIESGLPVISGATGIEWPEDLNERLQSSDVTWIWADNFALGMNLVKHLINTINELSGLYREPSFQIHEIHHVKKLDAPSGTALRWQDWLQQEAEMTYVREGDVVGTHQLTLDTEFEKITLTHEAKDRRIFAHGAVWATRALLERDLPSGLLPLDYITAMHRQGEYYVSN